MATLRSFESEDRESGAFESESSSSEVKMENVKTGSKLRRSLRRNSSDDDTFESESSSAAGKNMGKQKRQNSGDAAQAASESSSSAGRKKGKQKRQNSGDAAQTASIPGKSPTPGQSARELLSGVFEAQVKDVVVHGIAGVEGVVLDKARLQQVFEPYGDVAQVLIRHRTSSRTAESTRADSVDEDEDVDPQVREQRLTPTNDTAGDQSFASPRASAREKFDRADTNGSGELERSEIQNLLLDLGMHLSPDQLNAAIEDMDPNGDNKITYEEFLQWYGAGQGSMQDTSYAVISFRSIAGVRACLQAYDAGELPSSLCVELFDNKKAAQSSGKMVKINQELKEVEFREFASSNTFQPADIFSALEADVDVKLLESKLVPSRLHDFLLMAISPKDPWRMRWDIGVLVVVVWSCLTVPYAAAYTPDQTSGWTDKLVDLVFYADIFLNFFTGYDKGYQIIMDKKKIVRHYVRGWFVLDLVATVDWEWIGTRFVVDDNEEVPMLVKMLALIKISRLLRASHLIDNITADWTTNSGLIDAGKFAVYVTVVAHLLACFFSLLPVILAVGPECEEDIELSAQVEACIRSMGDPGVCGDLSPSDGVGWYHKDQCRQMGWAQQQGNEAVCVPKLCADPKPGEPFNINYDLTGYEDLGDACYEYSQGFLGVGVIKLRLKDETGGWLVPREMTPEEETEFLLRAWNTSRMQLPRNDPNYQKATLCMSPMRRYSDSLYWSLTTMTTIGYGDRGPKTEVELVYTMFAEVFGLAFFALLLTQIDNVAVVLSMESQAIRDDKDGVLQFLKTRHLKSSLVKDVVLYLNFRSNSLSGNAYVDGDMRFEHLSDELKTRIRESVYMPRLRKVAFFGWDGRKDPEEEMVRSLFNEIDTDGSGFLDRDEILALFKKLDIELQGEEFHVCYNELDKEGNGHVSFAEFSWWWFLTKYGVPRISSGVKCPKKFLTSLCQIVKPMAFGAGERIVNCGQYGDRFILLMQGKLRVLRPGVMPGKKGSSPNDPERKTTRDMIVTPQDREPICGFSACLTKAQFEYVKLRTDL